MTFAPLLPSIPLGFAVLIIATALWWSWHALARRFGPAGRALWWPRLGLGLLLVLLLAGPRLTIASAPATAGALAVIVDTSSSMDLTDGRAARRLDRALRLADRLAAAAPGGVRRFGLDTRLREPLVVPAAGGDRPGDPAAILANLADDGGSALAGCAAAVVLTDGGDAPFAVTRPPAVPVSILRLGPPAGVVLDNIAIEALTVAPTAEVGVDLPVAITVAATGSAAFRTRAGTVPVILERWTGTAWTAASRAEVAVVAGRAAATCTVHADEAGPLRLRARLTPPAGDANPFDDVREALVEVRRRSLHVLVFTREISAEFRVLRSELGRDPGLTCTALVRTLAARGVGDRYALIGDRLPGDEAMTTGLPTDAAALGRYAVIVVGAFPPAAWRPGEAEALRAYVDAGGGVVFLADTDCAADGVLSDLLPVTLQAGLQRGSFPLAVPPAAASHPVTAGLDPGPAAVDALRAVGAVRPGASVLLASAVDGAPAPVLVVQPWGRGRSAVMATNTLWRLAATTAGGDLYGRVWRQLVRWLGGGADGGSALRLSLDRDRWLPGDEALASLAPAAADITLAASLVDPTGVLHPVALEADASRPGGRTARLRLVERGLWTLRVEALRDGKHLETVERLLPVAPRLGEGSGSVAPEVLARAAAACGGRYADEDDAAAIDALVRGAVPVAAGREVDPLAGWWTVVLVLVLLGVEWRARRRLGVV